MNDTELEGQKRKQDLQREWKKKMWKKAELTDVTLVPTEPGMTGNYFI